MERVAETRIQLECLRLSISERRLHLYAVRAELVCAAIGSVEHGIVECHIESPHRIRNGHLDFALLCSFRSSLVLVGHDNRRIIVLSRGRQCKGAEANGRGNDIPISFHIFLLFKELFLAHFGKTIKAHFHIVRNIVRVRHWLVAVPDALERGFRLTEIALFRE